MTPASLVLIRHPRTAFPPGICYGRLDVPLASGFDAAPLIALLAELDAFTLWSSPACRCRAVADRVQAALGVPVHVDARLQELDFGDWEGRPWTDVPRDALDRWAASPSAFAPPAGESGAALIARTSEFFNEIGRLPGSHVIVSHGGPLRLLAALARGRPPDRLGPDLLSPAPGLGSIEWIARPAPALTSARTPDRIMT